MLCDQHCVSEIVVAFVGETVEYSDVRQLRQGDGRSPRNVVVARGRGSLISRHVTITSCVNTPRVSQFNS